jgi:hypothetical protein
LDAFVFGWVTVVELAGTVMTVVFSATASVANPVAIEATKRRPLMAPSETSLKNARSTSLNSPTAAPADWLSG